MTLCQICITDTKFQTECGCNICLECLINWFGEKNKNVEIQHFKCPNQECLHQYSRNVLLKYCQQQPYQSQIQTILAQEYLKNKDIRPCPNGNCNNYGYINLGELCDDELECGVCGMKWKDFELSSYTYQLENALSNTFGSIRNFLYCFTTANECPTCGVLIQRNGGCKHMTCKACNGQFCWYCKQNWIGHKGAMCSAQQMAFVGVQISLLLNILYQTGILQLSIYLFYPLKWILILFGANAIPAVFIFGMYGLLNGITKVIRRIKFLDICQIIAASTLLTIVYFAYEVASEWLDLNLWDIIKIIACEAIVALLVIGFLWRKSIYFLAAIPIFIVLWYFTGIDAIALTIWLLPYIFDLRHQLDRVYFKIGAYTILVVLNIFDLYSAITSYHVLMLIGVDLTRKYSRYGIDFLRFYFSH